MRRIGVCVWLARYWYPLFSINFILLTDVFSLLLKAKIFYRYLLLSFPVKRRTLRREQFPAGTPSAQNIYSNIYASIRSSFRQAGIHVVFQIAHISISIEIEFWLILIPFCRNIIGNREIVKSDNKGRLFETHTHRENITFYRRCNDKSIIFESEKI